MEEEGRVDDECAVHSLRVVVLKDVDQQPHDLIVHTRQAEARQVKADHQPEYVYVVGRVKKRGRYNQRNNDGCLMSMREVQSEKQ